VPPDPALKCYLQGLDFGTITALRGKSHRSIVVISNYKVRPDDGGTMPGKRSSFTLPVEPISPPPKPASRSKSTRNRALVEAPGTAPGSEELISTPFIAVAAQGGARNISLMAHFSKGKPNRDMTGGAQAIATPRLRHPRASAPPGSGPRRHLARCARSGKLW
jgi:hypothetical protein